MLAFDRANTIEGLTVWGDDKVPNQYYYFPKYPRYRLDANGLPVVKLIEYRQLVERGSNKPPGAGFLICDLEFAVDDATLQKVKDQLQADLNRRFPGTTMRVQLGQPYIKRGAAHVACLDSAGGLVQKIQNPASPSLFPNYTLAVTVEFDQKGIAIAKGALQGQGAGILQVAYNLAVDTALPPLTAEVWVHASKFYEFHQHVNIDWNTWGDDEYRETLEETWRSSDTGAVKIDPGSVTDRKVIDAVTDWAWKMHDDAIKRMIMGEIAAVPQDERKVPDGIENVWRDQSVKKVSDFYRKFTQGQAMEWDPAPNGTLPAITALVDKQGKPLKFENFFSNIDTDDPFFRQINVAMQVNADFQNWPIHSVELHVDYPKQDGGRAVFEEIFTNASDLKHFQTWVVNNDMKYDWWYQVNYKGQSKAYKSPVQKTDEPSLVVNVDDVGVLSVNVENGDMDLTDDIKAAQVTVQYEDLPAVPKIARHFTLDSAHQKQQFQHVIFTPVVADKLKYQVKYLMKNGKEFTSDWKQAEALPTLTINDVWSGTKAITFRATGDLENKIDTIFAEATYTDDVNKYTQNQSVALSQAQPFFEWKFPVVSEASGKIIYSGTIKYKDGTEDDIPLTELEAQKTRIEIGPVIRGFLQVMVDPALMFDDPAVRLVSVALHYADQPNGIDTRKSTVFRPGDTQQQEWKVELKNKAKKDYDWQATFFLQGTAQKKTDPVTTIDDTIFPQLPA